MKTVLMDLAQSNRFFNNQFHQVLAKESQASLEEDQKAFFGSIFGTLNHILLVDKLFMSRITGHPVPFTSFKERLAADFPTLMTMQSQADHDLIALVEAEENPLRPVTYQTFAGHPYTQPFFQLVVSLALHATHHRGQISTLCHQRGIPVLDYSPLHYFRAQKHGKLE